MATTKRIIYPSQDITNGICVIVPSGEISVTEVARKDVPAGLPFKIIDTSDLPFDREFRDAWEDDFTNPDGYGIGSDAWFAERN